MYSPYWDYDDDDDAGDTYGSQSSSYTGSQGWD